MRREARFFAHMLNNNAGQFPVFSVYKTARSGL